jgi:hypothetical protein
LKRGDKKCSSELGFRVRKKRTGEIMKQNQKWFATALAVAGGLVIAGSARAQTQVLCDFHHFTLSTTYGNWSTDPSFWPNPWPPIFYDNPFEVIAWGEGSGHYDIPLANQQLLDTGVAQVTLTLTLNSPDVSTAWLGVKFVLDDNQGNSDVWYGAYTGLWGTDNGSWASTVGTTVWVGNTLTMTVPLTSDMLTAVQTGNDKITGFNLLIDPAYFSGGDGPYDITFNSLAVYEVPEPATLALFAIGVAGFVIARRRMGCSIIRRMMCRSSSPRASNGSGIREPFSTRVKRWHN